MTFTPEIYEQIREGAKRSAAKIVPLVVELAGPETVVDVGCGEGWFAREFAARGCFTVGLDSAVATGNRDGVQFEQVDVPCDWPFEYDLAVCLEVAEHLPEGRADDLVAMLCARAPVVLFSAAIPGQGGHGHLNEQWPGYWASKLYGHGLVATEALRREFWDDDEVEPWYRQNLLLFARNEWMDERDIDFTRYPISVVHPVVWEHRRQR